jgi:DHA2 family multidrug resistance protein
VSFLGALAPRPPDPPAPGPGGAAPGGPPPLSRTAAIGLAGAVLGSLLSNVNTRLTSFAVADLRGAFGFDIDEGAWVTEAYNVAQIAIVPLTPWLGGIISPRRAIAAAVALQALASVAAPVAPNYVSLVVIRFLQGVGGGALIPLLLTTVLRFLPMHQRIWGFAVYALVTTSTPLFSESLSGVLTEYVGWQAIFWQNLLPGAVVMFMVLAGLPVEATKPDTFRTTDYFGMFTAVLFVATLTAGLGEGQRLDWFDSEVITGLFAAALVSLAVFVWHSLVAPAPLINLRLMLRANFSCGLLTVVIFAFSTLGTSYVLPQFGAQIRGFRELQVGEILGMLAVAQIVLCPAAAALLRVADVRVLLTFGLVMASLGSRMATWITADWVRVDFLPALAVQACALPFIMVPLLLISTSTLQMQDATAGGTLFNCIRTLAGTIGTAVMGAIITVRERVHSNVITDHLVAGAAVTVQRAASGGPAGLAAAATRQAYVMAYADAYGWLAVITACGLVVVLFMRETRVAYPPKALPAAPAAAAPLGARA